MSCIESAIADHFKVFFRDMADQTFDEIHSRDGFLHIFFIFVTVVVESNHTAIVAVDSGGGNGWPARITFDIFDCCFGVTQIGFILIKKNIRETTLMTEWKRQLSRER